MNIGIIGRTRTLLNTVKILVDEGYPIRFLYTCRSEPFYDCESVEFENLANEIGADFYNDLNINTEERVNTLSSYQCDLAISMNWLNVLQAPICKAFKNGIWNAHMGDLPRYRGNACPNWAILNGEEKIGLSIHEMVPGELDSGDIILKEFFPLTEKTYIGDIYQWMNVKIPELFLAGIKQLQQGVLNKTQQSLIPGDALRCYPRKPNDGKINWSESVKNIYALVRASSAPFSGAFCFQEDGQCIFIWEVEPFIHNSPFCAIPGQVMMRDKTDPIIACGDGALKITKASTPNGEDAKPTILKSLRNRLI
ncbi:methionyl-tRNA formyltransferase [Legionella shakespearei]|uniref:Methionyl tRNA formyltransferase n=1 Tax=Legionella shakespearei DSM 23087 TaxID=1122169 RepID=A0A0W0YV70_9GAMM|nr:formyltransferase family protein [Legionella shakespearei]KTD60724.1 methionyl tRNA formyltransferase [Legionella shakespearei DSM 23087]